MGQQHPDRRPRNSILLDSSRPISAFAVSVLRMKLPHIYTQLGAQSDLVYYIKCYDQEMRFLDHWFGGLL